MSMLCFAQLWRALFLRDFTGLLGTKSGLKQFMIQGFIFSLICVVISNFLSYILAALFS